MNHDDSIWRKLRSRRNFIEFLKDKKTKNYFLTDDLSLDMDFVLTTETHGLESMAATDVFKALGITRNLKTLRKMCGC